MWHTAHTPRVNCNLPADLLSETARYSACSIVMFGTSSVSSASILSSQRTWPISVIKSRHAIAVRKYMQISCDVSYVCAILTRERECVSKMSLKIQNINFTNNSSRNRRFVTREQTHTHKANRRFLTKPIAYAHKNRWLHSAPPHCVCKYH